MCSVDILLDRHNEVHQIKRILKTLMHTISSLCNADVLEAEAIAPLAVVRRSEHHLLNQTKGEHKKKRKRDYKRDLKGGAENALVEIVEVQRAASDRCEHHARVLDHNGAPYCYGGIGKRKMETR